MLEAANQVVKPLAADTSTARRAYEAAAIGSSASNDHHAA
jgi:hypothetical protein